MDHKVKLKESEKIFFKKYLDLARELKKMWNISVAIISIVVNAFRMVSKGAEIRLEEMKSEEDLWHLDHSIGKIG